MLIRCRKCGMWGRSAGPELSDQVRENIGESAVQNAANVCVDCTEDFAKRSKIPIEILWKDGGRGRH